MLIPTKFPLSLRLDIVPKQFFANAIDQLYRDAYTVCPRLEENCKLVDINPALVFDKNKIIAGVNRDLGTSISTINEAFDEVSNKIGSLTPCPSMNDIYMPTTNKCAFVHGH